MNGIAYAMGQSGASAGQGAGGGFAALVPLLLMFVIFYFLLIRPQQKKAKSHQEMLTKLKKDDRVVTTGGICGKIASLDDTRVTLEIADKVRIKVLRGNIASLDQPAPSTQEDKKDK